MKTRDDQAKDYVEAIGKGPTYTELVDVYKAYRAGWDAALASQWRDASEELPQGDETSSLMLIWTDENDLELATWNAEQQTWHYVEGVGALFSGETVLRWMPIPDLGFEEEQ